MYKEELQAHAARRAALNKRKREIKGGWGRREFWRSPHMHAFAALLPAAAQRLATARAQLQLRLRPHALVAIRPCALGC